MTPSQHLLVKTQAYWWLSSCIHAPHLPAPRADAALKACSDLITNLNPDRLLSKLAVKTSDRIIMGGKKKKNKPSDNVRQLKRVP